MGDLRPKRLSGTYLLPKTACGYFLGSSPRGVRKGSIPNSHSHVVSLPVWLERLSRFAEALHRVDVNALGCGGHVAQGHVVEHALVQWRDLLGHGELLSSRLQDRQS